MNEKVSLGLDHLIARYPVLAPNREQIQHSYTLLLETVRRGNKILICGNGGSASDADHIVGELMKSFVKKRPISKSLKIALESVGAEKGIYLAENIQDAIPAINLTQHTALSSAFANDVDPHLGYAQQVMGYGVPGDLLWGLSTSGNAENVLNACIMAKAKGLHTMAMTGNTGGKLKGFCDVCICVPETETYIIQELHLPIYHFLCIMLEESLW
ncbi:MAG TPA: SIS domain-containing protein [Sphaerochaeta sp.]|nr:SIS domain-containing protein [Sphaerochaeta sp.]